MPAPAVSLCSTSQISTLNHAATFWVASFSRVGPGTGAGGGAGRGGATLWPSDLLHRALSLEYSELLVLTNNTGV